MSEPIITGLCGKGWEIQAEPDTIAQSATLKCWFLDLPGAHPFWHCYMLSVVSLRDILGVPPAQKQYPDAEYEMHLIALNPELKPNPSDLKTITHLYPPNYVSQFHELTDSEAITLGLTMAQGLVDGKLIAEPQGVVGARSWWDENIRRIVQTLKLCRSMK